MKSEISLTTAGGGKTYRLINRINNLIDHYKTKKERILVISFTNATCNDIKKRSEVVAHTLHSFAFQFISANNSIVQNAKKIVQIFLDKYFYLSKIGLDTVTKLLESYFIFQTIEEVNFLEEIDQKANEEFLELIKEVQEEKRQHSIVFFSEIIHKFKNQLDNFLPEIFQIYDHILIDEAQDLSEIQLEIIFKLIEEVFLEEDKSFYVVGDVKQSIYDFQGSSPQTYLNFIEDLKTLCDRRNIPLEIEISNKTYRFGGDILRKINSNFESHLSSKNEGQCYEYNVNQSDIPKEVENIVNNLIENKNYSKEDIMILYERNSTLIKNVQEKLIDKGFEQKIPLMNNRVIESLLDINNWLQTGFDYYRAKILQGPFFHMDEPDFYNLCQENLLKAYEYEFFTKLMNNPMETIINSNFYGSELECELLKQLYLISKQYYSFSNFIYNLPDFLLIKKSGIKYSTVHSAKGLESPIVIYINQKKHKKNFFVNLKPFFFFSKNLNEKTQGAIQNLKIGQDNQNKNVYYVAITRAKEILYIINVFF